MTSHKILLLAPALQDKGGVTNFCKLLVENLNSNFEVDYFQIGNRPWNNNPLKRVFYFFMDSLKLINKLRSDDYDLVHLNPSFKILSLIRDSFFLIVIINIFHRPALVLFHGWNVNLADRVIHNPVSKRLLRRIYSKVSFVLVLCNQFKQQLMSMGFHPEKVKVITTMYKRDIVNMECNKNEPSKKINILFMSRLVKEKGVYIVLEVTKTLLEHGYKDFKIFIAGDGPEYKNVKQNISENRLSNYIETLGYITGEKKWKILGCSDIFLFPTYYGDGCPIVILEALGAGLAVISTPVAAIPDIVIHNENGFIVDSKDPKDFFKAIQKLIDDRKLLRKIQEYNKITAEENYEAKVVTGKVEVIYSSINHTINSEMSSHG